MCSWLVREGFPKTPHLTIWQLVIFYLSLPSGKWSKCMADVLVCLCQLNYSPAIFCRDFLDMKKYTPPTPLDRGEKRNAPLFRGKMRMVGWLNIYRQFIRRGELKQLQEPTKRLISDNRSRAQGSWPTNWLPLLAEMLKISALRKDTHPLIWRGDYKGQASLWLT